MASATITPLHDALDAAEAWKESLRGELVEREEEIDLFAVALVARESLVFFGPPGVAKTMTYERGVAYTSDVRSFYVALGPLSTLEEPFGPLSMPSLMKDQYRRVIGYFDDDDVWQESNWSQNCHLVLWDEAPRATKALTDSGLQLMNQRTFNDNGRPVKTPLSTFVVCANSEFDDEGQEAFRDRLLISRIVPRVYDKASVIRMLKAELDENPTPVISWAQWETLQQAAKTLPVPDEVYETLADLERALLAAGVGITPRRLVKAKRIVQAVAVLDGASQVEIEHLAVLEHVAWTKQSDQPAAQQAVLSMVAPGQQAALTLLQEIENLGLAVAHLIEQATDEEGIVNADNGEAMELQKKLKKAAKRLTETEKEVGTSKRSRQIMDRCRARKDAITGRLLKDCFDFDENVIQSMLGAA